MSELITFVIVKLFTMMRGALDFLDSIEITTGVSALSVAICALILPLVIGTVIAQIRVRRLSRLIRKEIALMYDNYTYQYLRDYIKPLLDKMFAAQEEIITALTSEDSRLNQALISLISRADTLITTAKYILWLVAFIVFLSFTFKFLQARWFTVR